MFSHIRNDWMTSRVLQFKYCIFWFLPTIILKTGSLLYIGSLFHVKPWPSNTDLEFHPKVVGFRVNSKFHIVWFRIWSQRAIKMLSLSRKKLSILQKCRRCFLATCRMSPCLGILLVELGSKDHHDLENKETSFRKILFCLQIVPVVPTFLVMFCTVGKKSPPFSSSWRMSHITCLPQSPRPGQIYLWEPSHWILFVSAFW